MFFFLLMRQTSAKVCVNFEMWTLTSCLVLTPKFLESQADAFSQKEMWEMFQKYEAQMHWSW